ncbi:Piso0_000173 [Millerozyma farinosa CBS 7064]|uniref:Piso0_000173 protein n=1 Tax=Pichia sorbitophila (strain ATCC MYA-4447 / BCRC 22081 / CBS 7064 / NBRC 10061 / NRRL Y-12695) TaxID=559304 RepID=G8YTA1_PICSO|nr:Piso0_000173 [Millerozyma farinosa CBS 7064]
MAEKFERHKSTRWIRASIPTYGNDWDDDYDYDQDYDYEDEYGAQIDDIGDEHRTLPEKKETEEESLKEAESPSGDKETSHVVSDDYEGDTRDKEESKAPGLVLSIDHLKRRDADQDDSTTEEEEESEDDTGAEARHAEKKSSEKDFTIDDDVLRKASRTRTASQNKAGATRERKQPPDYIQPTPRFAEDSKMVPETPVSDKSFQSDADSIQHEPSDLNVKTDNDDEIMEPQHTASHVEKTEPENADQLPPLVLSIDSKSYSDDSGDENDEQDADSSQHIKETVPSSSNHQGLSSAGYANQGDTNNLKGEGSSAQDPIDRAKSEHESQIKTDILSSLIKDLQGSTLIHENEHHDDDDDDKKHVSDHDFSINQSFDNESMLPKLDSIRNFSLPNFENESFDDYSEEQLEASKLRAYDENYDDNPSPITPVEPLSSGRKEITNDSAKSQPQRESTNKQAIRSAQNSAINRNKLVSVDYANIADAVSGYLVDPSIKEEGEEGHAETNSSGRRSFDMNEIKPVKSTGSLSTASQSISSGPNVRDLKDPSSGSSTKGDNRSDHTAEGENDEEDITRRDSVMTTNTFNMGNWVPNPSTFRDQFINTNDNESSFNFNLDSDAGSVYSKFVKKKGPPASALETISNASSLSVPDTIDVPLPSIMEDPDNVDDSTDSFKDSSLEYPSSSLNEKSHRNSVFQEDDTLMKSRSSTQITPTQRYSSLLTTDEKDLSKEGLRVVSDETAGDKSKLDAKRNITPSSFSSTLTRVKSAGRSQNKPTYNWKTIMSASQPIDRLNKLRDALEQEYNYNSGLQDWLVETLKSSESSSNIHIGKIATEAYKNASHTDVRRHISLRSKVSFVKDKVETSGLQASTFGKKFFHRGKKFVKDSLTD